MRSWTKTIRRSQKFLPPLQTTAAIPESLCQFLRFISFHNTYRLPIFTKLLRCQINYRFRLFPLFMDQRPSGSSEVILGHGPPKKMSRDHLSNLLISNTCFTWFCYATQLMWTVSSSSARDQWENYTFLLSPILSGSIMASLIMMMVCRSGAAECWKQLQRLLTSLLKVMPSGCEWWFTLSWTTNNAAQVIGELCNPPYAITVTAGCECYCYAAIVTIRISFASMWEHIREETLVFLLVVFVFVFLGGTGKKGNSP